MLGTDSIIGHAAGLVEPLASGALDAVPLDTTASTFWGDLAWASTGPAFLTPAERAEGSGPLIHTLLEHCGKESQSGSDLRDPQEAVAKPGDWTPSLALLAEVKETGEVLAVKPCGCRQSFCPHCAPQYGRLIRDRLTAVLQTFEPGVFMLTLTLDPKLFEEPGDELLTSDQRSNVVAERAFRYCNERRVIGEFIKEMKRRGAIKSERYYCQREFQRETKMVHFHLILEAAFVPIFTAMEVWGTFRPKEAGAWAGWYDPEDDHRPKDMATGKPIAPEFGSVRYSLGPKDRKVTNAVFAARYVAKYITKVPANGFPDWVQDYEGQLRRFTTSHGFWQSHRHADGDGQGSEELAKKCSHGVSPGRWEDRDGLRVWVANVCSVCVPGFPGAVDPPPPAHVPQSLARLTDDERDTIAAGFAPRRMRTIRERQEECRSYTLVMAYKAAVSDCGELVLHRNCPPRLLYKMPRSWADTCERLGMEEKEKRRYLTAAEVRQVSPYSEALRSAVQSPPPEKFTCERSRVLF